MSKLLTIYGNATGSRRPTSDMDCLTAMVEQQARIVILPPEEGTRAFTRNLCRRAGISLEEDGKSPEVESSLAEMTGEDDIELDEITVAEQGRRRASDRVTAHVDSADD
jgi:hypothetical protein